MSEGKLEIHDLVMTNRSLNEKLISAQRSKMKLILIMLLASFTVNLILIYLISFHFPVTKYLPNTVKGACVVNPLSKPVLSMNAVRDFATQGATGAYSFDFLNYRRQVSLISEKYFTDDFTGAYLKSFGDSELLRLTIENKFIVSASLIPEKPVFVSKRWVDAGRYKWEVQVPFVAFYQSGRKLDSNRLLAEVTVIRSEANPSGIAIDNIITRPLQE